MLIETNFMENNYMKHKNFLSQAKKLYMDAMRWIEIADLEEALENLKSSLAMVVSRF
jgi:hypothetical protein